MRSQLFWFLISGTLLLHSGVTADERLQDQAVHHDHQHQEVIERPKVFLDKSPRIVEYQLKRLDNRRLLLVERSADDPRFAPVYQAILMRPGMALQLREEAATALARIRASSVVEELLVAIATVDLRQSAQATVAAQLTDLLLQQPEEILVRSRESLLAAAEGDRLAGMSAGLAALIMLGEADNAWQLAHRDDLARIAWLKAVSLLPTSALRATQRPLVVQLTVPQPPDAQVSRSVLMEALPVLAAMEVEQDDAFRRIAALIRDQTLREVVVAALLQIPDEFRDVTISRQLVQLLVKSAEETPAADRTTDAFVDAMTLAEQLLRRLDSTEAQTLRQRLRAVSVRVVRIRTVHEEMRYDVPWFAVEAGRPVQIVLQNDDLMPHNLVFTQPGTLQQVAMAGVETGPTAGWNGLPYVPVTDDVLFATGMVEAGKQDRLTFDAPLTPGEYPYVCTFPRHWMRMYGVMVVVEDLDAWQRSGTVPADPLGNTRTFIQSWKVTDFSDEVLQSLPSSAAASGEKLFQEATCLQCHRVRNQGGQVGPDLTQVVSRWKNDYQGVLKEILDPSYKIDPRYAVQVVLLKDGRTLTGILQAEDARSISLLVNPERPEPQLIPRAEIEEMIPSATSMMPKALLDKFTQQEVLEILAYLVTTSSESDLPQTTLPEAPAPENNARNTSQAD